MALQLMKILVDATATIETDPTSSRYFYITTSTTAGGATLDIDAASFLDDTGTAVTSLPTLPTNNSYFNVFINGVLQMNGISTYTPGATGIGSLEIAVPVGGSILTGTPIVLEIVSFAPTSDITVST